MRRVSMAVLLAVLAGWGLGQLAGVVGRGCVAAEGKGAGSKIDGVAAEAVARQLTALALQCDANHDLILQADEQAELVKIVGQQHGPKWADRTREFLKSADTNHDGQIDQTEWKVAIQQLVTGAAKPAAAGKTYRVEMSDGVHLATDVFLPDGPGPFPVIFTRTPYGKEKIGRGPAQVYPAHGFAYVIQDMRGRFASEGENLPFIGCGWGEHRDGVESIAWIRKQPWCNGKIGTEGDSAMGITQNMLAGAVPEGLTAQYIAVAPASMYADASYVGGALRKCQAEDWTVGNRFDPKAVEIIHAHPNYDDYWRGIDTTTKWSAMNVPAIHRGGWFDTFQQGTIDSFVGRQHQGAEGARGKQKLVIGPWHHGGTERGLTGELRFPNPTAPDEYSAEHWFDYHLKGMANGVMDLPAVTYYVMGDTSDWQAPGNRWRTAADWPVPSTPTQYYLAGDGSLRSDRPAADGARRTLTFDPADPCPTVGGCTLTIPRGPKNQNRIESRKDVLLYTTEPLAEPLEVTGRVRADIYVASSAVDSDLSVRLCDVYPDGKSYLMADGMLRLRHRNSLEKAEPLTPGEVVRAKVDCWSTSIIFNRGHRVRVTVTSSNFPRFDVNPGTGQPWTAGGTMVKQTNQIYADAAHPSCIVLPVVRAAESGGPQGGPQGGKG